MWIVAIAWIYVTLMMALAEATSPQGTVLGAFFTFVLYGVGPLALVLYLLGAPARRKAILRAEREALSREQPDSSGSDRGQADGSGLPPADPVTAMREKPPGV
jgi:hypothetical protein